MSRHTTGNSGAERQATMQADINAGEGVLVRNGRRQRVTVRDVAAKSGCSATSVSHILGKHGHRYLPETRERVLAAAKGLGYRPNASARAMLLGRFDCLALVQSTEQGRSSISAPALEGLSAAAERHDCHLSITRIADAMLEDRGLFPKLLRQLMADGMLVNYNTQIPPPFVQALQECQLPCIWMRSKQPTDCIYPDEYGVGVQATRHLIGLGHTRIAYADYGHGAYGLGTGHFGALDCERGYWRTMEEAGLAPRVLREKERVLRNERPDRFRHVFEGPARPTALVTYALSSALPAIHAALTLGLAIPRDLSLVTFGAQLEDIMGINLTTVASPEFEYGSEAVEMLMVKISEPERRLEPRVVACRLLEGDSCAPPPPLARQG